MMKNIIPFALIAMLLMPDSLLAQLANTEDYDQEFMIDKVPQEQDFLKHLLVISLPMI